MILGIEQKWHVLIAAFSSYFFDAMGMAFLALSLTQIMQEFNLTKGKAGLLNSAMLLGMGFSSVLIGRISDRYGRKKALITSLCLFIVFGGSVAFVRTWEVFMVLNFCSGLGLGGIWSCNAAFVNETWPAEQRGRACAFVMSAGQLGMAFTAVLSLFFLTTLGWRKLYMTAFLAVAAVLYIIFAVKESEAWRQSNDTITRSRIPAKALFKNGFKKITIAATGLSAFAFIATWGINTWLPTYLVLERGLEEYQKTTFLGTCYLCQFLGQQVFGRVSDKIGRKKTIRILLFSAACLLILFVVNKTYYAALVLAGLVYFVNAFAGLAGSYYPELYPTQIRGLGAGFCFNVGRGISAISPFLLGSIATRTNLNISLMTSAFFFALAPVFLLFLPSTQASVNKPSIPIH